MKIHTIGDSHSVHPWNKIDNIIIHHQGPKLCYSIGRDGINLTNLNIKENDLLIFCFGEIDCRCHIIKYITETKTYKDIIDEIVNNYFIAIHKAVSELNIKVNVSIYNVVPPLFAYSLGNPEYPHLGTNEQRKQFVLYFNEQLKYKCKEYNYIFFDIYNKYVNSDGFIDNSLSDSDVHISNPCFIQTFIQYKQQEHHFQFDHLNT